MQNQIQYYNNAFWKFQLLSFQKNWRHTKCFFGSISKKYSEIKKSESTFFYYFFILYNFVIEHLASKSKGQKRRLKTFLSLYRGIFVFLAKFGVL